MVLGAGLGAPAEVVARGLARDVEFARLAFQPELWAWPAVAFGKATEGSGSLGDRVFLRVGARDGFRGVDDHNQGGGIAGLGVAFVHDLGAATGTLFGDGEEPAAFFGVGDAVLVRQVEPGANRLIDAGGLEGESGDMDLESEVDDVRLPGFRVEGGRLCLELGIGFGGGGFDFDQVHERAVDADHIRPGHQVAVGEGRLVQGAVARFDFGQRTRRGGRMAFLGHIHIFARVVDADQLLEHVATAGEHLHVLILIGLTGQGRTREGVFEAEWAFQSEFEE